MRRLVALERLPSLEQEGLHDLQIGLVRPRGQAVAARMGLHPVGVRPQPAPQPRHHDLERGIRDLGLRVAPECAREGRIAHRAIRIHDEQCEERPRLACGNWRNYAVVIDGCHLAEDAKLHACRS